MSVETAIEWCDSTWNPIRGCSRVSSGCMNCYAERVAARFSGPGQPYEGLATMTPSGPRWTGEVRVIEKHLADPLKWTKPRRIFVNSMSDLFHMKLRNGDIDRVFAAMALCPDHTFLILTKRPERMQSYIATPARAMSVSYIMDDPRRWPELRRRWSEVKYAAERLRRGKDWPLANVWLGISAENQATADQRIPPLLDTPAARRFVSAEPLLGPIDFSKWITLARAQLIATDGKYDEAKHGAAIQARAFASPDAWALHWIIVGGESGPGARPMDPAWATAIRDQCDTAGVAFFFKQWGGKTPKAGGRELEGRIWNQMPRRA